MPKLIRSRNHSSLCSSPSSISSRRERSEDCGVACLSYYSPVAPPWDVSSKSTGTTQRKVSEDDMNQYHDHQLDENTCSRDSSCSRKHYMSHSISSLSSTTTLKRRKPSVCLTDLLQQHQEEESRSFVISPTMTSINQGTDSSTGSLASSSGSWGHFTSDDLLANDDTGTYIDTGTRSCVIPPHDDDDEYLDHHRMAHSTSFMPIPQQSYHTENRAALIWGNAQTTTTSWSIALSDSHSFSPKSRAATSTHHHHHHHHHPYNMSNHHMTMKRRRIVPPSQHRPSEDQPSKIYINCNAGISNVFTESLQQPSAQVVESSFDDFILICPTSDSSCTTDCSSCTTDCSSCTTDCSSCTTDCYDNNIKNLSMDNIMETATKHLSVLGL